MGGGGGWEGGRLLSVYASRSSFFPFSLDDINQLTRRGALRTDAFFDNISIFRDQRISGIKV